MATNNKTTPNENDDVFASYSYDDLKPFTECQQRFNVVSFRNDDSPHLVLHIRVPYTQQM